MGLWPVRELEAMIRRTIDTGLYADADAVVREATRLLDGRDRWLDALRAGLQIGLEQAGRGEGRRLTPAPRGGK